MYNFEQSSLPEAGSNPALVPKPRRWTILAAGFLLLALSLVVIYTSRSALLSPLALVVVAAIGLAALLLEIRLRRDIGVPVHAPSWLNIVGLVFAVVAIVADIFRLNTNLLQVAALGAVACFAVSGVIVFRALRKRR